MAASALSSYLYMRKRDPQPNARMETFFLAVRPNGRIGIPVAALISVEARVRAAAACRNWRREVDMLAIISRLVRRD